MGITFAELLEGKTVRNKRTGSLLKVETANSASDIIGWVVFPGQEDAPQGLSGFQEHLSLIDIDPRSLRGLNHGKK